jgi:hypothetical protein
MLALLDDGTGKLYSIIALNWKTKIKSSLEMKLESTYLASIFDTTQASCHLSLDADPFYL